VVSNGLVLDKNGQKMSKRLGNAIDPFETLQKYGPDATRWYMISNANPWENLKFDLEGIDEVRRKFFGTFTTRILSLVCMRMLTDLIILKKKLKTDQKSTDGFYLN
jgi:isoleucyl-tRNA synthetase